MPFWAKGAAVVLLLAAYFLFLGSVELSGGVFVHLGPPLAVVNPAAGVDVIVIPASVFEPERAHLIAAFEQEWRDARVELKAAENAYKKAGNSDEYQPAVERSARAHHRIRQLAEAFQNQVEIFARSNATQIVQTDVNGGYRVTVRPGHYYVISRCPLGLGLKVLSLAGPVNVWGGFQSLDLHGGDTSNRNPDDLLSV